MKKVANWRQIALVCIASIPIGIVTGMILQMLTYQLLDSILPHPNGHGSDAVYSSEIPGAIVMAVALITGATVAQFLTLPLGLSFILLPRSGARVCIISMLLLSGLLVIEGPLFFTSKHDLILFGGFPFLCVAVLAARAAYLHWISLSDRI